MKYATLTVTRRYVRACIDYCSWTFTARNAAKLVKERGTKVEGKHYNKIAEVKFKEIRIQKNKDTKSLEKDGRRTR